MAALSGSYATRFTLPEPSLKIWCNRLANQCFGGDAMRRDTLLTIDAAINLLLGVLLIAFSDGLVELLGVPPAVHRFYPNILGGVLFGIGIALMIERRRTTESGVGLGLGGAVAINLCGGIVLCGWLVFGDLSLPLRGLIFLWVLVVLLVGISTAELAMAFLDNRHHG
jgi:hypothetical protein